MNRDTLRLMLGSYITTGLLAAALALVLVMTASSVSAGSTACGAAPEPPDKAALVAVAFVGVDDIGQLSGDALAQMSDAIRHAMPSLPLIGSLGPKDLALAVDGRPEVEGNANGVALLLPLKAVIRKSVFKAELRFDLRAALRVNEAEGEVVLDFANSEIRNLSLNAGAFGAQVEALLTLDFMTSVLRRLPPARCLRIEPLLIDGAAVKLRFARLTASDGHLVAELRSDAAMSQQAAPLRLPDLPSEWPNASSLWVQEASIPAAANLVVGATFPDGVSSDGDPNGPYRFSVNGAETGEQTTTVELLATRSGWLSGCVGFVTQLTPAKGTNGGVIATDPAVRSCSFPSWLAWLLLPDGDAIGEAMTKAIESQASSTIRLPGGLQWSVRVADWTAVPGWLGAKVNMSEATNPPAPR